MEYRVTWIIDVDAGSFEEAASAALEIQRDPESLATHFIVRDQHGKDREVWASHRPSQPVADSALGSGISRDRR